MTAILYKDIAKIAYNILYDDYDFNRKLKIKTKTGNGVAFTTEGTMSSNNSILAKLSAGYKHSSGINVSRLQVTTHGRIVGEVDIADALIDGLKLSFKMEDGSQKNPAGIKYKHAAALGSEYRKGESFSLNADADFANNVVTAASAFKHENFVLGGQVGFNVEKSTLSDHNIALSFVGKDFHASILSKKKFGVISASFDHCPNPNVVYAGVLDFDVKTQLNILTVGGRYSPDPLTTLAGKVDSDGLVSLAVVQQVRPQVSLTTSAHIDVKNLDGESHKFGLGITLG